MKPKLFIKTVIIIYSICLIFPTVRHIVWIVQHGIFSNLPEADILFNIFWDSLTILYPVTIVLLFFAPRKGLLLLFAIIALNITVSIYVFNPVKFLFSGRYGLIDWAICYRFWIAQVLFGLFVFITVPIVWKKLKQLKAR